MLFSDTIVYDPKPSNIKKNRTTAEFPLTYRRDPEDDRDFKMSSDMKKLSASMQVDHTSQMTSVKNQGRLGSCVGFAVTALKEWQEKIEHEEEVSEGKKDHRKGKEYNLSESWVYWNAKKIDPWPGEEGTSIRFAMKVLNKIGVPTEKAWPYSDTKIGDPASWAPMISKWACIGKYWRVRNLKELKIALKTSPVPIGIPCFREIFYVGKNGIINYPANPANMYGGHAVCAVGYDNKRKLIKFKNSWGKGWGKKGYGYITYAYINNFLWDAWSSTDINVTRDMLKETKSLYG